ncbi:MAG: hypothetical protein IMZ71_04490 [Chloroflexi bacterium]|nr:hypothetical protein [Chloroflexota bacterium]
MEARRPVSGKRCPHCRYVKPLEAFYVKRNGHLASWCKECMISSSHRGRGTGYRRVGLKRRARRSRPVLAEEEHMPPPPIAPLRLVDGRCAYAFPRGKVRCWRMTVTCARTCCRKLISCPWLAKAWE